MIRCQPLVEQAVTEPASANTIQILDDISDHVRNVIWNVDIVPACTLHVIEAVLVDAMQLCQVYDSAEFCRNVHSDPQWQNQALQAVMIVASKSPSASLPS